MEETSALARPYALAAFEQATNEDELGAWGDALGHLGAVVSDREVADLIANPRVPSEALTGFILDLCEGHLSPTRENFVKLLLENDRVALAPAIAAMFERERSKSEGRARVEVISAFDMGPQYQQMLTGAMAKRLGRQVELSVSVDSSLIGGAIIRTGDVVIDASLKGRLRQLAAQFV